MTKGSAFDPSETFDAPESRRSELRERTLRTVTRLAITASGFVRSNMHREVRADVVQGSEIDGDHRQGLFKAHPAGSDIRRRCFVG